jgi:hypothetical protein
VRPAPIVLVLAFLLVPPAGADIGVISVSRTSARPGDLVVVRFGGYANEWPRMPAYLVPSARATGTAVFVRSAPRGWPYVFIGRIHYAPPARGRVRFRVPRVPSGTYHFVVYCAPCIRGPGGSLVDSSPTFYVL